MKDNDVYPLGTGKQEKELDEALKMEHAPITLLIAQNAPQVTEPRYSPADMLAENDTKDQYTDDSDTV